MQFGVENTVGTKLHEAVDDYLVRVGTLRLARKRLAGVPSRRAMSMAVSTSLKPSLGRSKSGDTKTPPRTYHAVRAAVGLQLVKVKQALASRYAPSGLTISTLSPRAEMMR